ncbi:MAG: prepilin-type N-terminal cleavage/methylation domain-containing protein [Flavobacteriaceae bacterium]|nr:prepilin-type N-terminal cleavage/methylation domain-containing protein [Flavobacteriaceae bacterium]
MKKRINHIKAFTILEVVISLALMSIIISMVYSLYAMLSKQLYVYSDETELVNNYNQLHSLLVRDVHNSNKLVVIEEGVYLLSSNDTIKYYSYDDSLIRMRGQMIDTFLVKVPQFNAVKENMLLGNRIKRIEVTYDLFGVQLEAVYFKDYGVSDSINNTFFANGN